MDKKAEKSANKKLGEAPSQPEQSLTPEERQVWADEMAEFDEMSLEDAIADAAGAWAEIAPEEFERVLDAGEGEG